MSSIVEWVVTSCVLILVMTGLRFLCRGRIKPLLQYALWLPVLFRLLVPFSFAESVFSIANLLPEALEASWGEEPGAEGGLDLSAVPVDVVRQWQKNAWRSDPQGRTAFGTQVTLPPEAGAQVLAADPLPQSFGAGDLAAQYAAGKPLAAASSKADGEALERGFFSDAPWWCFVWLGGSVLSALLLTVFHGVFAGRVYRSRKLLKNVDSRLPVYVTAAVQSPCMFGLVSPAIYLPGTAWEKENLHFVLRHENMHFVHGDHLWAYLRLLVLCVHWYNPLVWLASALSRQDGELACDAAAVADLDDRGRQNYGRALIQVSAHIGFVKNGFGLVASMSGSKRCLRERILRIAQKPMMKPRTVLAVLAAVVISVMMTFTGRSAAAEETEGGGELPLEDAKAPAEEEPEVETWTREADFSQAEGSTYRLVWEMRRNGGGDVCELVSLSLYRLEETGETRRLENIVPVSHSSDLSQGEESLPLSLAEDGGVALEDLNFDGWTDLYFPAYTENGNTTFSCYLWKPELSGFVYAFSLENLEVHGASKEISSRSRSGDSQELTRYYSFNEEGELRYTGAEWAEVPETGGTDRKVTLTLHYCDDYDVCGLSGEMEGDRYQNWEYSVSEYARQALEELYQWSGTRITECWYGANTWADFYFATSQENLRKQHFFYSRGYGEEVDPTVICHIMAGYQAKSAWWDSSVATAGQQPPEEEMAALEGRGLCAGDMDNAQRKAALNSVWYLEHNAIGRGESVESVVVSYQDAYVMKTAEGHYYEADVNPVTGIPCSIFGPYDGYPNH